MYNVMLIACDKNVRYRQPVRRHSQVCLGVIRTIAVVEFVRIGVYDMLHSVYSILSVGCPHGTDGSVTCYPWCITCYPWCITCYPWCITCYPWCIPILPDVYSHPPHGVSRAPRGVLHANRRVSHAPRCGSPVSCTHPPAY